MSHGIYQLQPDVNHLSQLSVVTMPAMSNRVGGVMQGAGVSIDTTGLLTLAPATSNVLGGVKIGSGVNVGSDGTISVTPSSNYVLPPATSSVLGGVKVGTNIAVAGDGTISLPSTINGAITFSGLINATAGLTASNAQYVGFLDPTNSYTAYGINCGPGGNWNLNYKASAGASFASAISCTPGGVVTANTGMQIAVGQSEAYLDTGNAFQLFRVINSGNNILLQYQPTAGAGWSNQVIYYIGTNKGLTVFSDPAGVQISGVLSPTKGISCTGGTGDFFSGVRALSGSSVTAWNSNNTAAATLSADVNGSMILDVNSGQNIILNKSQVWGGAVNANTQNLSNVNTLTAQGVTINGATFLLYGPSSKYFQVLPNDGTYADPRIYSNTGNIRCFTGMSFDGMVNIYNQANLTFGSNWLTGWAPSLTASTGTVTATAWYNTRYMRVGPIVFFTIRWAFNTSAAAPFLYVTLPITSAAAPDNSYAALGTCSIESGPSLTMNTCFARQENADHFVLQQVNNANFPSGSYTMCLTAFYRVV